MAMRRSCSRINNKQHERQGSQTNSRSIEQLSGASQVGIAVRCTELPMIGQLGMAQIRISKMSPQFSQDQGRGHSSLCELMLCTSALLCWATAPSSPASWGLG
eukprot:GGOE01010046.1.p1 GENE.GGOE01010046.1~~GGOE01010046.1.p1  ORF type:complete len:103 (+),score=3.79 GGOE01010046.1:170-478(+)